jgi:hypothetical protein
LFPLRPVKHAPNQRNGVQIADGTDLELGTGIDQIPVYRSSS